MSSYKFEYNEYIWDILYYLIMKRFNFNIETIRLRREFFQKPIVMNLEYEMQMRNCLKKQRKLNTNYLIKTVKEENKCNRNFPICKEIKNFENKKKPLLEFWGISKKLSSLQDKNFIIEDYFFKKIKQRIRNSKKLSQYNKENFETTKKILENLNKSIELDSIKLSKSIDFGIDIDKDLDLSSFEENSKNKDENENEIIQINEVKIKSSVKLDKINLTNLQIININMQKSDFNLITNYDVIEKYENENSNNIDDLKIERHLHYCENEDLSISKSNSFCESENISVNENNNHNYNNQIDSLGISNNNNYDSIYIDNGNNLTEECKNIPNSSDDFNKRVRLDSIENSFDEWGSQKFTPSPKKMEMKLLK
jgi:hypothetical protein